MNINVHHYIHNCGDDGINEKLLLIIKNQQTIMASNEELNSKLDELQTSIDEKQAELEASNAALEAKDAALTAANETLTTANEALTAAKTSLEAELANSVNPEQTQAAIAKVDASIADIKSTPVIPPVTP